MRSLVLLTTLFVSAISHAAFVDQFKPFRTYYMAQQIVPLSHQFEVWMYDGHRWNEYLLGLQNRTQVGQLQTKDFHPTGTNNFEAGNSYTPPKFRALSSLIVQKTKRLFPVVKVRLAYLGYASRVLLTEVIPQEPARAGKRFAFVSHAEFNLNSDGLEHLSYADQSSLRLIEGSDLPRNATLLNFSRTPKMEGSSLLDLYDIIGAFDEDYGRLLDFIQDFARGPLATHDNEETARNLFERQGLEIIPSQYDQVLNLSFTINSWAVPNGHPLTESVYFALPSQNAFDGTLELEGQSHLSQIHFQITGSI